MTSRWGRVRAARESGEPKLREALREKEVEALRTDIDDLQKKITSTTEPERGALIGRLVRAQDRLLELLPKPAK